MSEMTRAQKIRAFNESNAPFYLVDACLLQAQLQIIVCYPRSGVECMTCHAANKANGANG